MNDPAQRYEREQWRCRYKRNAPTRQAKRQKSIKLLRNIQAQLLKKLGGLTQCDMHEDETR